MERNVITIPRSLFAPVSADWQIDWRGQDPAGGGGGVDGTTQVVFNAFPRWTGAPTFILTGADIREWRARMAALRGRANVLRLPLLDMTPLPWDRDRLQFNRDLEYTPFCQAVAAAAKGAQTIVVDETVAPGPVQVGQYMSHDDWPFIVTSRTGSGASVELTVEMPLRAPIPQGALIRMEAYGRFIATSDLPANPVADTTGAAVVTLEVVESLIR